MSESVSGHTMHLGTTIRDRALITGAAAAILWLATIALILTDVALQDRIPNDVGIGLAVLAGTATVVAVVLDACSIILRRIDEVFAARATAAFAARLRQLATVGAGGRSLDRSEYRSEYWQVYNDVLQDLGGVGADEPPEPSTN